MAYLIQLLKLPLPLRYSEYAWFSNRKLLPAFGSQSRQEAVFEAEPSMFGLEKERRQFLKLNQLTEVFSKNDPKCRTELYRCQKSFKLLAKKLYINFALREGQVQILACKNFSDLQFCSFCSTQRALNTRASCSTRAYSICLNKGREMSIWYLSGLTSWASLL